MSVSAVPPIPIPTPSHAQGNINFFIEISDHPDDLDAYNLLMELISGNEVLDEDLINLCKLVKALGPKDPQHGLAHVMTVTYNTISFIQIALLDDESNIEAIMCNNYIREVFTICMIHDILDQKYTGSELRDELKKKIRSSLEDIGFTDDRVRMILEVTVNVGFTKQDHLDEYSDNEMLKDLLKRWVMAGDLTEAIGKNGLKRSMNCVPGLMKTKYKNTGVKLGEYEKYLELVIKHMDNKLLLVHESIKSEIAKKITYPLHLQIVEFRERYNTDPDSCLKELMEGVNTESETQRYLPCGYDVINKYRNQ